MPFKTQSLLFNRILLGESKPFRDGELIFELSRYDFNQIVDFKPKVIHISAKVADEYLAVISFVLEGDTYKQVNKLLYGDVANEEFLYKLDAKEGIFTRRIRWERE